MFTQRALKQLATANITRKFPSNGKICLTKPLRSAVADPKTGTVMSHANDVVDEDDFKEFRGFRNQ
jgi:hypothetical protein